MVTDQHTELLKGLPNRKAYNHTTMNQLKTIPKDNAVMRLETWAE